MSLKYTGLHNAFILLCPSQPRDTPTLQPTLSEDEPTGDLLCVAGKIDDKPTSSHISKEET